MYLLLYPFSLLYAAAVWFRNRLYDCGWLHSRQFEKPVIVTGNLIAGGAGKTPMTEYLVRLLSPRYRIAVLSRGYGRRSTGFIEVTPAHSAAEVGDEPLQLKCKFRKITVAVCEDRVKGVNLLQESHDLVLLDDAFQHRALKPGLSLLLFEYHSLHQPKRLLPAGRYRDLFSERERADILIVTKTPETIASGERTQIISMLARDHQRTFFSSLRYLEPAPVFPGGPARPPDGDNLAILLVTGIANPTPLFDHLRRQATHIEHMRYRDHYTFSLQDVQKIRNRFLAMTAERKYIITTEKDAQRLRVPAFATLLRDLPLFYIGIETFFPEEDRVRLDEQILSFCDRSSDR